VSWKRSVNPVSGWNTKQALANPRPPAVPASLDLTIEEYFAAAGAIGLLAAQLDEPDPVWAAKWALEFGITMAAMARTQRLRRKDTPKRNTT
jgi:hypothetical protein